MRHAAWHNVSVAGVVLVVILGWTGAARADFTDNFNDGTYAPEWKELDFTAALTGGAWDPFTLGINTVCDPADPGLLGQFSDLVPGTSDDIAVAVWWGPDAQTPDLYTDVSLRMLIRYPCHPAVSCDPFEGVCRGGTSETNALIMFRSKYFLPAGPAGPSFDCYWVELHDNGALEIGKLIHIEGTINAGTPRLAETIVSLDPSRDVWMRAEIQTIPAGNGPSVRIRARVWQDRPETPGDGTEDEPVIWQAVGDDYTGRDAFENDPRIPDNEVDPYAGPAQVGVGWNEDSGGGWISELTLDDVTGTAGIEGPGAVAGDFDGDGDVDLADFGIFQACFNGPNRPPACP